MEEITQEIKAHKDLILQFIKDRTTIIKTITLNSQLIQAWGFMKLRDRI